MKDSPEKIQWHPAFAAAMGLEFRDDYKYVTIQQEYNLSKEPIRIDLLISRNDKSSRRFGNEIGHIMKIYNIIEYKSPEDIDAVLQASVSANKELYEEIRRDSGMCQALRELMKDEIEGAENRAEKRGEANLISNMYNNGVTPEQISSMTNVDLDTVKNIIYRNEPVVATNIRSI